MAPRTLVPRAVTARATSHRPWRGLGLLVATAVLSACGGGGGGGGGGTIVSPPAPTACTVARRNQFVHDTTRDWYLFLDLLPASVDTSAYASPQELLDAMTATARAQGKDRGFSYVTSIAEENAYIQQGSQAGFGIRLRYDSVNLRLYIIESFEGSPAGDAGLARGDEITAISSATDGTGFVTVESLFQSGGQSAVSDAFGPSTAGVARSLKVLRAGATSTVTMTKRTYSLQPVPLTGGTRVIESNGRRIGYVNLRTFIDTADPALRSAFQQLQAAGVSQVIVDLRYNGGGLVRIGELLGDLLGANRTAADVFSRTAYNTRHADQNTVRRFASALQSIGPSKIAFITTGSTASASELVINAFLPYGRSDIAIIGDNTYGKPVGQSAFDLTECDDRLRLVAFATQNASGEGDYFSGLAGVVGSACRATDDITRAMGDPAEGSTQAALSWLATGSCPGGSLAGSGATQAKPGPGATLELLRPDQPTPAQRDVPGLF